MALRLHLPLIEGTPSGDPSGLFDPQLGTPTVVGSPTATGYMGRYSVETTSSGGVKSDIADADISESHTIMGWFRFSSFTTSTAAWGTRHGNTGFMLYRNAGDTDGYLRVYYWYNNDSGGTSIYPYGSSYSGMQSEKWHHLCISRTADGTLKTYLDGVITYHNNTPPTNFVSWNHSIDKLSFGCNAYTEYVSNAVRSQDIRYYDHVLSDQEVAEAAMARMQHLTFANGSYEDSSGMGNHAYKNGGTPVVEDAYGRGSQGLRFTDGDGARSDTYIQSQPTTMTGWIKLDSYPPDQAPLFEYGPYLNIKAQRINAYWHGSTSPGYHAGTSTIPLNTWTMITAVWDGTNLKIYRDGELERTVAATPGQVYTTRGMGGSGNRHVDGVIGEASIYCKALTDAEIKRLYEAKASVYDNGAMSCSAMDEIVWHKLINQDMSNGAVVFNDDNIMRVGEYPDDYLYSRLSDFDQFEPPYILKIVWPNENLYAIISQDNSIWANANVSTNFSVIDSNLSSTSGLNAVSVSNAPGSTYFDAYNHPSNWFYAIATKTNYASDSIPGPTGGGPSSVKQVELYIAKVPSDTLAEDTTVGVHQSGTMKASEFIEIGYTPSVLDYSTWEVGNSTATNWGRNGAAEENIIEVNENPWGQQDVMWGCRNNNTGSDSDGGWSGSYIPTDTSKPHRYSVWVRRVVTGNGSWYLGANNTTGDNGLLSMGGSENSNPYFRASGSIHGNEWFLVVGYVYPNVQTTELYDDDGCYLVDGTKVVSSTTSYRFKSTATHVLMRCYLYYSTQPETVQLMYRPRIDIMDGTQPSIQDLLDGSENPNIIHEYSNGQFSNSNARINQDGTIMATNFREI